LTRDIQGDRTEIGVVREVDLSAITDTYPRSTVADVLSIGATRRFIRTANGLDLLHRFDFASAPKLDRVLVAGNPSPDVTASADHR
jgi:hypothetical protein